MAGGGEVLDILERRGFIRQVTDREALRRALDEGPVTFYVGFDPTGSSLHVGHLVPIMAMAWLQRHGHRALVVLGGGTARVGDPSGKDRTREMLSPEAIARNLEAQRAQLARFLDLDGERGRVLDNAEWLLPLRYIDFLREIGRHFSVNKMIKSEGARQRLERDQGLSFIEFNYHLLQSYDFLVLHQRHGCTLQLGGDDQWFNILGGVELIRRVEGAQAHAFTVPLVLTADGRKMGKTEKGAAWLDPDRLSPYDYYQYWINVADADVRRFLHLYTFLDEARIAELTAGEGEALREAKAVLAFEATALAHGEDAARDARFASRILFGRRGGLDAEERRRVVGVLRGAAMDHKAEVALPAPILDVYVALGLCASKGEARRLVRQGGARVWGEVVRDEHAVLDEEAVVWAGRKRVGLVLRAG